MSMSLDNLVRIGQLKGHAPDPVETLRLLASVERNISDYSGDPIDPESVRECIARATELLATTRHWLKRQHPHLLA